MSAIPEQVLGGLAGPEMRRAGCVTDHVMHPACRDGVVRNMPFDAYSTGLEVSKSVLWTAHTRSLRHGLHSILQRSEPSNAMALGAAVHCAVLEPDEFSWRFHRGPDDRRGLRWKEALEEHGEGLLTAGDYDAALAIRDALLREPLVRKITQAATLREASGFWTDSETGLRCRCRPDGYAESLGLLIDLKTTRDARAHGFARSIADYGYHAQEAFYSDGWRACGLDVAGFVFIAVETEAPFAASVFELGPQAVEEGRAAMRATLQAWAEAERADQWPAYPQEVQRIDLPRWAYRLTSPPDSADEFF